MIDMTDLNQEDATMLQGLQDALMHLTNRLLSATEVANSVAELQTRVGDLTHSVSVLTSDVETYRNRNLDLDAALSAVRRERDEAVTDYDRMRVLYQEQFNLADKIAVDRDEAINKQLEADQRADDLGQTIKRLQDDLHAKNEQLVLVTAARDLAHKDYHNYKDLFEAECKHSEVLRIKLNRIEDVLSGAAVEQVAEAKAEVIPGVYEEPQPVTEAHPIQAIEDRPIDPPTDPVDESPKYDVPRYGSSW